MVNTPPHLVLNVEIDVPGTSHDLDTPIVLLEGFMKRITESMEAMKKQNEDIVSWLLLREDPMLEERREVISKEIELQLRQLTV
jgi:hypothetical protein